jgi:hypothetical protein
MGQLVPVGLRGTLGVLWRLGEGQVCTVRNGSFLIENQKRSDFNVVESFA